MQRVSVSVEQDLVQVLRLTDEERRRLAAAFLDSYLGFWHGRQQCRAVLHQDRTIILYSKSRASAALSFSRLTFLLFILYLRSV